MSINFSMNINMRRAKQFLAILWLGFGGVIFAIILFQIASGRYPDHYDDIWEWYMQFIIPTLSMIIGVLVWEAVNRKTFEVTIDKFLFRISFWISFAFLLAIVATLLLTGLAETQMNTTPFKFVEISKVYLVPIQSLVNATLGIFFVKNQVEEGKLIPKEVK